MNKQTTMWAVFVAVLTLVYTVAMSFILPHYLLKADAAEKYTTKQEILLIQQDVRYIRENMITRNEYNSNRSD